MTQHAQEVEHEIEVAAPATAVYELIADVANWPRLFPPTIFVQHVERGTHEERIQIWATANGEAKSWVSHRTLDPQHLRIGFRQEVSAPPVAAMGGTWTIEPLSATACRVRLGHEYRAVDDDAAALEWIDKAVDRNSRQELAALRDNAEAAHANAELTFSFEDSVRIDGSVRDAYEFVHRADLWPQRLPHVAGVELTEVATGLQILEMETRAKDGSTHVTKSYRVCIEPGLIAYKQVTLPALMSLHTGTWTFQEGDNGIIATSQHTVTLNTEAIPRVLGTQATVTDARKYVTSALSTNSSATLEHARRYAEDARTHAAR